MPSSSQNLWRRLGEDNAEYDAPRDQEVRWDPKALLDAVPEPIIMLGDQLLIVHANSAATHLLRCPVSELVSLSMDDLLAPHANGGNGSAWPNDADRWQTVLRRRDGSEFAAEIESRVLPSPSDEAEYTLLTIHDVTHHVEMRQALKLSEALYRRTVETSPDAVSVTELSGRIMMANKRAAVQLGYESVDELLAHIKNAYDVITPSDRPRAHANAMRMIAEGGVITEEFNLVRKGGEVFAAEISTSCTRDADGRPNGFVTLWRDVTERKEVARRLRIGNEKLQQMLEVVARFMQITDRSEALHAIAEGARQLASATVALLSRYDTETGLLEPRLLAGWSGHLDLVTGCLGFNPMQARYRLPRSARAALLEDPLQQVDSLYELAQGTIPESAANILERVARVGEIWALGLTRDNELLGVITLFTRKGAHVEAPDLLKVYAHHVTSFMTRLRAEWAMRESQARF
jgi:PAS domain S-box-containing protein